MAAITDGSFRWADAFACFLTEQVFDDPVFERVVRDHDEPSARFEERDGLSQAGFKGAKLVVDGYP